MNFLFDKMKILGNSTNKNAIECEYFYMGSEGFVFKNLYIPLDAISIVKMLRIADEPLKPYVIMMCIGLFLLMGGIGGKLIWLALIGFVVLIFGGFLVYSTWKENKKKVYSILLKLNNGENYMLTYGTLDFTVKVVNKIRTCIAEKNEAKNYFVNKGNIQYISDNSIGKVCDNIFNGNIGKILAGTNNSAT